MKAHTLIRTLWGMALLVGVSAALAQPPDSLWSRTFGGSGDEECYSVQQTSDGGYILGGYTGSFGAGSYDFWLVKTDGNGDSVWSRTFGGSDWDMCYSVQQTLDGGYILGGYTGLFGPASADFWLVKTDANGNGLWSRTFGGSYGDMCYSVQQTLDGGYILGGYTGSFGAGSYDFWLMKTNANGDSLWSRIFGGSQMDMCYSVRQTRDGGYILGGCTSSFGPDDPNFWLVKTNANGDSLWSRTFGGSDWEMCYSVQQTLDGGYILGGYRSSSWTDNEDFWLVRTDANGNLLWNRGFGGSGQDRCRSVQETSDGGYILGGYGDSFGAGLANFCLVKTDADGNQLWSRTFGGSADESCASVQQVSGSGYILAGTTESFGAGGRDFWLVKTGPELAAEPITVSLPVEYTLYPNWPNPFNPTTEIAYAIPKTGKVSLRIFNLLGEQVATLANGVQSAGTHTVLFDGSGLASGVYLCRLQAGGFAATKKMVLLK